MGDGASLKSKHLARKLAEIRRSFGLSQNELIRRMGLADLLEREEISAFERGIRQPPLLALLQYARLAGICLDVLVDDELDLPEKIPGSPKHPGIPHQKTQEKSKIDK